MLRYNFDFDSMLWQHMRNSITRKGKHSIWYKLLYALSAFFVTLFESADYIYSNIFLQSMDIESLRKVAKHYNLVQLPGESLDDFRTRIRVYRSLLSEYCSVKLIKRIFMITCGVEPSILQYSDYSVFTIGVTPLGEGVCIHSLYGKFIWKAILPDLSTAAINRELIKQLIDQFNIASNDFIIIEQRAEGDFIW